MSIFHAKLKIHQIIEEMIQSFVNRTPIPIPWVCGSFQIDLRDPSPMEIYMASFAGLYVDVHQYAFYREIALFYHGTHWEEQKTHFC